MKNEKFETHQCFIWILMKNMSITEVFVSTPPLSGNEIRRGLVIVKDITFGLFQNCFIMDIQVKHKEIKGKKSEESVKLTNKKAF